MAAHFTRQPTTREIREKRSVEVLWQGDPISLTKSFGCIDCTLCMQERIEILKIERNNPKSLINSRNEFYGACYHKAVFHTYVMNNPSTDEASEVEKSNENQPREVSFADV